MGLQEKRVVKTFQEEKFPDFKKQIEELTGENTSIEVDWEALTVDGTANFLEAGLEKVYFISLIEGLKTIAIDDMGKEALQEAVTKIIITNTNSVSLAKNAYKFENGALTVDHKPGTNHDAIPDRIKALEELLSQNL